MVPMRWIALLICVLFLTGCKSIPEPDSLIGMNEAQVIDALGPATSVTQESHPGASVLNAPQGLRPGEPYRQMFYENVDDRWWMVLLAEPLIYERTTSRKAEGTEPRVFRVLVKAQKPTHNSWSIDDWWHDPFIERPPTTVVH